MKVIGYCRVSTAEQASGNSLDFQRQAIENYCKECQLELVGIYTDIASGTKRNREGLDQALETLEGADGLILYHTDRLSRKLAQLLNLIDTVAKAGKCIISTSQPEFDLSSPTGRLMLSLLGAIAEFELSRITERMVSGRKMVKQKAEKESSNLNHGLRPAFHQRKHWDIQSDGTILKTLVLDEQAFDTIQLIKRHRRSGKSYYAIAKWLNLHQVRNKSGCKWNSVTVKRLCNL